MAFLPSSSCSSIDPVRNRDDARSPGVGDGNAPSSAQSMPSKTAGDRAKAWWREHSEQRVAVCDRCSGEIEHGAGYLRSPGTLGGPDLLCESCWYAQLGKASPSKLRALREEFKLRTPRRIDYRPSCPTGIGFDPPLILDETDYHRLAEAVGYGLRADERPFGVCRFCNQTHRSAGLVEWLVSCDDAELRIGYGCRNCECEGNDEVTHFVSTGRIELVNRLVWGIAGENRHIETAAFQEPNYDEGAS